jgi:hypothetical protein
METNWKKFASFFLVFVLGTLPTSIAAKERKGAELFIEKTDGPQIKGELIAVKQHSLLLLNSESGADVSVDIGDIRLIEIVKESKVWEGIGLGLLSGAVIGVLTGYLSGDDSPGMITGFGPPMTVPPLLTADDKALAGGIVGGLAGGALGGIGGTIVGADKTIHMEKKSDTEIKEILHKLSKKARVRNFQ